MDVVYCAGRVDSLVVQNRYYQLQTIENGTLQTQYEGGGNHPFTIAQDYAWYLDYDGISLSWVSLTTGESGNTSGFSNPMFGIAGLDTLLLIGVRSREQHFELYSISQFLSGASPGEALIDSLTSNQGMYLWGGLHESHQVYGTTDCNMSGELRELMIGIWDIDTGDITSTTVPFQYEGLLGMVESPSEYFIGAHRILRQAVGMTDELNTIHEINIEPRFFRYPIQVLHRRPNHQVIDP
jgi:hypothetical protein